jgi:hypothetical protein
MLLRLSKSDNPLLIIFIVLMALGLHLAPFLGLPAPGGISVYQILPSWMQQLYAQNIWAMQLSSVAFSVFVILLMAKITSNYMLLTSNLYLPGIIYLLISAGIYQAQTFGTAHIAALLILLSISCYISSYKREREAAEIFEGNVYLGIASLIYPPAICFIVCSWIGLAIFRPFRWREWFFVFAGIGLPHLLFIFNLFFFGKSIESTYTHFYQTLWVNASKTFTTYQLIFLEFIGFLIIISTLYILKSGVTKKTLLRKSYNLFLYIFIVSLLIWFFIPGTGMEMMLIGAIPVAYLLGLFFSEIRQNWLINLLFTLLTISSFAVVYITK